MLFRGIEESLQRKVLVALLGVGIVPYFFIMLYFTYWGRDVIVQREHQTHMLQAEQAKVLMQSRLRQLEREVAFLAGLELFDDMISGDIDQRIERLLEQKRYGLQGEAVTLMAVDLRGTVVAASHREELGREYALPVQSGRDAGTIATGDDLIFFCMLKASFDGRPLGYLIARYPLENLARYVVVEEGVRFSIGNDTRLLVSGPRTYPPRSVLVADTTPVVVTIPLMGVLEGYRLSYTIGQEHFLGFVNRFMFYLTLLFVLGVGLIVWIGRRLATQVVGPVEALTDAAEAIIRTGKYDLRVRSTAADETGTLAAVFNRLIETTEEALERLSRENRVRMQRFVDLTDMFNHITRIEDERACIGASIDKLSRIVPYPLAFVPAFEALPQGTLSVPMQLNDFSSGEPIPYGHLVIEKTYFEDESERRFLTSVAAMISLQVERIGLIKKIRSASAAKTAFISNMSHELRTPLNAIIGFSQYLMAYEALSDEQLDTVSKIENAAVHLLGMINDILDIAKIEAGKMELHRMDMELRKVLQECMEMVAPMAEEKGLGLERSWENGHNIVLHSDERLLKQVFINLLSNAIKFTESGAIDVSVEEHPDFVAITIADTGIGIEPDALEKVFDAFTQLPNSQQEKFKGTGLGLSLSRQIVHTLGGELLLQSEGSGKGTKAVVKLGTRLQIP